MIDITNLISSIDLSKIQFDYNSKVILSYFFISLIAWFLNTITRGATNKLFFTSYRSSPFNPLTYIRMFTHTIGHSNWSHLINNFLIILLIGPMLEEKYGSINILIMLLITAFVTALYNIIFKNYIICGASDNVYMLIMLSSFSNISEGKIPLTIVLIGLFYVTKEIKDSIFEGNKKVSHISHILGAVCGLLFGFYFLTHTGFPI